MIGVGQTSETIPELDEDKGMSSLGFHTSAGEPLAPFYSTWVHASSSSSPYSRLGLSMVDIVLHLC